MYLILLLTHKNQTETSRSATKKKCSKSGGEKNERGDLRKEQLGSTLGFFGAGGHVEISGILNFWPFGVEQALLMLELETSITSGISMWSPSFEESWELIEEQLEIEGKTVVIISCFLLWVLCCCFLKCVVLLGCLVLVLPLLLVVGVGVVVVFVLPEGAIFLGTKRGKSFCWWVLVLKELVKVAINWHIQKLAKQEDWTFTRRQSNRVNNQPTKLGLHKLILLESAFLE